MKTVTLFLKHQDGYASIFRDLGKTVRTITTTTEAGKVLNSEKQTLSPRALLSLCSEGAKVLGAARGKTYRLDIQVTEIKNPSKRASTKR